MGSSLAVPQGTRSHPQSSEAACHPTTMQALGFTFGTLLAIWHHASPATKQAGRTETARIANKTGIDRRTVLAHTFERFQIAAGMHRSVEWSHGAQPQRVVLLLQPCQPGLVTLHLRLQLLEIQKLAIGAITSCTSAEGAPSRARASS
jgi:hypothetical protein